MRADMKMMVESGSREKVEKLKVKDEKLKVMRLKDSKHSALTLKTLEILKTLEPAKPVDSA